MQLKDRVDDLSKRVRGLEQMEKRLAQLEKRLAKLEYAAKKTPPRARRARGSTTGREEDAPDDRQPGRGREARRARPRRRRASSRPARRRARSAGARPRRPRRARCARPRPSGARRACPCRSSAPSSGSRACRRRRSARRRTAPSSGCASGASFIPPPCQTPFATITSCIRPRRSPPSKLHRHLGVLPLEEHAGQRIEERRLAAERLRHPVRALGDGAAHADRADVREPALARPRRPTCGNETRPASIVRGVPVERDAHRVVELRRDPVRAPEVHARPERDRREVDVAPGDAVHDLVQRAVAADSDDERRAAVDRLRARARSGAPAAPRRASRRSGPSRAARCASSGQRLPVAPLSDAGLTRKYGRSPLSQRSRRRARSSSSGRPRRAARRR